ncbi:MAG TPA: GNAT family N-acetyltransferase [Armatimonadota bacterium]|nr:GNAT family N-acetyltransferase [Armatimonadota bacterium]
MHIRPLVAEDRLEWLRMRNLLWPDEPEDIRTEIDDFLSGKSPFMEIIFVAERESGGLGGFVEVSRRVYADGCRTSPVGYLEGLYVDPDLREQGVARSLVEAAESWAIAKGCKEMGSDCYIDNEISRRVHLALGYEEKERIICFCKKLA